MEKDKRPPTPTEKLREDFYQALNVYQQLALNVETHDMYLADLIVDIENLRDSFDKVIDETGSSVIDSAEVGLHESLGFILMGKLDPEIAKKDPFYEDSLFSFPSTVQRAFAPRESQQDK